MPRSVTVGPDVAQPTHEISLSDGKEEWGLKLLGGVRAASLQELPETSNNLFIPGSRSAFGDYEPSLAQIPQSSWSGGRGNLYLADNQERFYDSQMMFTMIEGKAFPAPQWRRGESLEGSFNKLPGASIANLGHDVKFVSLESDRLAHQFTIGSAGTFSAENIEVWVKKVGSPEGSLTIALHSDNSGEPGAAIQTASILPTDVNDVISRFITTSISASTLSNSTTYWIVAYDSSGGNPSSHWEIGTGISDSDQAKISTDGGSSWSDSTEELYFRISVAYTNQRFRFFEFRGALYAVSSPADGSASKLYINGYRGEATSSTATTLVDSNASFTANLAQNSNAWIYIYAGTGQGQVRQVTANDATSVTVATWDIPPDTTSLYVIYSMDEWTDISPGAGDQFDRPVTDVLVVEDTVYFARDDSVNLFKMQYNEGASPPAHEFRDDTGDNGDLLAGFTDATNGYQLFVAENTTMTVTRYAPVAYGSNLVSGTSIEVGDDSARIIGMIDYNGFMYVFKEDGIYKITSDKALEEDTGLDFIRSANTGQAAIVRNYFLYFSWAGFALQQMQKNDAFIDMASIGPDRGLGLPEDRVGPVSALGFHPSGLFAAIDGGDDNYSSVLMRTDPTGWHEVFRAPVAGWRIRDIHWQDCQGTNPRLWFDMGKGGIAFQEWSKGTLNPLEDSSIVYQHEGVIVGSLIDMKSPRLPKYLKGMAAITDNLDTGLSIALDYQVDDNIDSTTWTEAGEFLKSPEDERFIDRGEVFTFRPRYRFMTEDASTPPVSRAFVLDGFARTPLKYRWNMRIQVKHLNVNRKGQLDNDPNEFMAFIKKAAQSAKRIHMKSVFPQMDDVFVIVDPPSTIRTFVNTILQWWGGYVNISVRES